MYHIICSASDLGLGGGCSPATPLSFSNYNWLVTNYQYGRRSDEESKFQIPNTTIFRSSFKCINTNATTKMVSGGDI